MYKTITQLDEYGDLFYECRKNQGDLNNQYQCCNAKCGSDRICNSLCRNIYFGTIPEDCASEVGCLRPEYVVASCIEDKKVAFNECCLKRCKNHQWSDAPAIAGKFAHLGIVPIDCSKYCEEATSIMPNRVLRRGLPYIV